MAKVNIKIPGLLPGQRYRLLITPKSDANVKFNAPSVAFTVPNAPDRLNQPEKYKLVKTVEPSTVVAETVLVNGTTQVYHPAVTTTGTISAWSSKTGSYNYDFTVNSTSSMKVGDHFIVDGISTPPDEYYDQLYYTITGIPSSTKVNVSARYDPTFRQFIVGGVYTNKSIWTYSDGRALSDRTNKANSAAWTNITPAYYTTEPTTSGVPVYGKQSVLTVNTVPKDLIWTDTVRDLITFMFFYNGEFYYLDNTTRAEGDPKKMFGQTPSDPTVSLYRISGNTPINYVSTNFPASQNLRAVHYLGESSIEPTYYWTVARYIKDGNGYDWYGQWLQKTVDFNTYGTMYNVLKAGVV